MALFSHRDDVMLANPWATAVRSWKQVSEALDFASSRFRDGDVTHVEVIASYDSSNLASIHETEW
jgi:hypothetical protein